MRYFFALLATVVLAGCAGYTIGPIKPKTMKSVTKLCVKNVKNETLEPRVEVLLANALIKQFQQDGTYQITDENSADAIVTMTLNRIERRPARSLSGNVLQTREFLLNLRCHYVVKSARNGIILDERNLIGTTNYFVTGENLLSADSNFDERQALPNAAEDVAIRLVSLVSEGW